jgi:excisionase family DNA binding protein
MQEEDRAPQSPVNSPRPDGIHPEGSGAIPAPAAPAKVQTRTATPPVTIGQLQRILQMRLGFTVSLNTLERWCREDKIRACRLGTAWRIPRDEVERIIHLAELGQTL